MDAYGLSKLQGERELTALTPAISPVVLRLGNLYGFSSQTGFDSLVNKLLLEAKYDRKIFVEGSGEQARPIVPVSVAAEAVCRVVETSSGPSTDLVVAECVSVSAIVEEILRNLPNTEVQRVNRGARLPSLRVELPDDSPFTGETLQKHVPEMLALLV